MWAAYGWQIARRNERRRRPVLPRSRAPRSSGTWGPMSFHDTPTAPYNRPEVRADVWKKLRPNWLSQDAAMMVLMAKLPSKLIPLASVYRTTAQVHAANETLMVRGYKHMTGTSRHAHKGALWGP